MIPFGANRVRRRYFGRISPSWVVVIALGLLGSSTANAQVAAQQPLPTSSSSIAPGNYPSPASYDADSWNRYMTPPGRPAGGGSLVPGNLADWGSPLGRQWFFGAYALSMSRDNSSNRWFASEGELTAVPFVLAAEATVLSTKDISPDATWGAEIRFGSTLGGGSNLGGQQPYAWELAYWGLAGDEQEATHSIATPYDTFLWGGIDYSGLEYNRDGTGPQIVGYIPVNYFFGHSSFWGAYNGSIRLLGVRVRNDFQAQNLELNFLKLPIYGGHATPSPISVTTIGGVRYLKFDEEFQNAVMFTTFDQVSGLPPNVAYPDDPTEFTGFGDDLWHLYHDIEVDNQLVGFQLGANLNWAVSRRWDLFCDGMFGVYNNRIEVFQHVYSGSGEIVRFASDQSPAIVKGKKDELALMGELRTGIGFQVTSHCRLTAAYRMMVVNGVALAVEQIPLGWPTAHDVATIHSNSSLVLHGLQLGAEFNF